MAGGQAVALYGYQFTARPLSWWRRFTHDFVPYWQASRPKFVLTVTNLQGAPTRGKTIKWYIKFATGTFTGEQELVPALETNESVNLEVGGKLLGFTGDTLLILPTVLDADAPARYETVYAFHTTSKSWVFLAIVAGILAGAFSTLGHWLFWQ